MNRYAVEERTIGEAVSEGGLLVVAHWEASEGQADKVASILYRFLPEAQAEPGAKLFLISRSKDNRRKSSRATTQQSSWFAVLEIVCRIRRRIPLDWYEVGTELVSSETPAARRDGHATRTG